MSPHDEDMSGDRVDSIPVVFVVDERNMVCVCVCQSYQCIEEMSDQCEEPYR